MQDMRKGEESMAHDLLEKAQEKTILFDRISRNRQKISRRIEEKLYRLEQQVDSIFPLMDSQ